MKKSVRLTHSQAASLTNLLVVRVALAGAIQGLQAQLQATEAQLAVACHFAALPFDRPVACQLEKYDGEDGVTVEWEAPDLPPEPPKE